MPRQQNCYSSFGKAEFLLKTQGSFPDLSILQYLSFALLCSIHPSSVRFHSGGGVHQAERTWLSAKPKDLEQRRDGGSAPTATSRRCRHDLAYLQLQLRRGPIKLLLFSMTSQAKKIFSFHFISFLKRRFVCVAFYGQQQQQQRHLRLWRTNHCCSTNFVRIDSECFFLSFSIHDVIFPPQQTPNTCIKMGVCECFLAVVCCPKIEKETKRVFLRK